MLGPTMTDLAAPSGAHKSGIIGRHVPFFEKPLPATRGPHQKVGWRKFEYPTQPYPILTTTIPYGSYQGKRTSNVSLPLHLGVVFPIWHPRPIRIIFLF